MAVRSFVSAVRCAVLAALGAVALLLMGTTHPASAQEEAATVETLSEMRARSLMREFACMVCDGQSIADSDAEVAVRMRRTVLEAVGQGLSDGEIRMLMAERYGEGALLRPPASGFGVMLWLAPLIIVLLGAGALLTVFRPRNAASDTTDPAQAP